MCNFQDNCCFIKIINGNHEYVFKLFLLVQLNFFGFFRIRNFLNFPNWKFLEFLQIGKLINFLNIPNRTFFKFSESEYF